MHPSYKLVLAAVPLFAALAGAVYLLGTETVSEDTVAVPPNFASAPDQAVPDPQVSGASTDAPAQAPSRDAVNTMVEIQGAVASPGVYSLPGGARLLEALDAAGGALPDADLSDLNIAARLVDGSVLSVPYQAPQGGGTMRAADVNPPAYTRSGWTGAHAKTPPGGLPEAPGAGPVNLNTATQQELETLPGVGPKTAEKIIRFRELQPFGSVDDLRYVQGIGDKRLETLRPLVSVQ